MSALYVCNGPFCMYLKLFDLFTSTWANNCFNFEIFVSTDHFTMLFHLVPFYSFGDILRIFRLPHCLVKMENCRKASWESLQNYHVNQITHGEFREGTLEWFLTDWTLNEL